MRPLSRPHRNLVLWAVIAAVALASLAGVAAGGGDLMALVVAGGALFIAAAFAAPQVVLVLALVGAVAVGRVAFIDVTVSWADLLMVLGTAVALRVAPRRNDVLILRVLVAFAAYFAVLAMVVAANYSTAASLELLHRLMLVPGPLLVGVAIVRYQRVETALRCLLVVLVVVAMSAVVFYASTRAPAYPFGIHKNAAGLLLAFGLVVTLGAPHRLGLRPSMLLASRVVLFFGLIATQSRGAALALVLALVVRALAAPSTSRGGRRLGVGIGLVSLVLVVAVAVSVSQQDLAPDASPDNALSSRTETFGVALGYWSEEPVFGAGLRYFLEPGAETGVAHNLVVNELAESGTAGLVTLVALLWVLWRAIRTSRSDLAPMAVMVFVVEVSASMLDVFWVAGRIGCALVLVGMALAEPVRGRSLSPARVTDRALLPPR